MCKTCTNLAHKSGIICTKLAHFLGVIFTFDGGRWRRMIRQGAIERVDSIPFSALLTIGFYAVAISL